MEELRKGQAGAAAKEKEKAALVKPPRSLLTSGCIFLRVSAIIARLSLASGLRSSKSAKAMSLPTGGAAGGGIARACGGVQILLGGTAGVVWRVGCEWREG